MRAGRVVASGAIDATLTSNAVSATFGLDVRVDAVDGRFFARIGA
jgi:ABC-type hemin transport system ATPase subunit